MNASKYKHCDKLLIHGYTTLGKSAYEIAQQLGLAVNVVYYRLEINGIQKRSISESLVGKLKSAEHKKALSQVRIDYGLAKGSRNPNWQGGKATEYDRKMSAIKRNPMYKAWRKAVLSIGYCKVCGGRDELEAHHILPKSQYPQFIHDIANGMCLCHECHIDLHKWTNAQSGKLLETPTVKTGTISSRASQEEGSTTQLPTRK